MPKKPALFEGPEFARLVRQEPDIDLTRVALELARDAYPDLDPVRSLRAIDDLAARVRDRCPLNSSVRFILGQINWVLYVEESFRGNTEDYYDPRNSYLNMVLERRTGIPISLSVLYRAIARHLGVRLEGLNLPGHFMLRSVDGNEPIFIDPFQDGTILDQEGCEQALSERLGQPVTLSDELIQPATATTVVARMLRNLKAIYLRIEDDDRALPVLRRLAALQPDDLHELRDWGLTCLRANRPGEAIDPLQKALVSAGTESEAAELRICLQVALKAIAAMN